MGQINVYKGLSNKYETIQGTGKLKNILKSNNPDLDFTKTIVLKEGNQLKEDYDVQDDDVLFVRYAANGTAVVLASISIVLAAISLGAGIYSAVEQQKAQKDAEKAQKEAKRLSESTESLPFLKGASNKSALGYSIPFIMGSMYDVPYKLADGYYSIGDSDDGETKGGNQYWTANLITGFNNAIIQSVSIGTTSVKAANKTITSPDGTSVDYIADTEDTPIAFDSSSDFYDSADKLAVKYSGNTSLDDADNKIIGTTYGDELDYAGNSSYDDFTDTLTSDQIAAYEGITKQLDTNTYKFEVCVAADGYRHLDNNNNWTLITSRFYIYYNDGSDTWTKAGYISAIENSRKTVRFSKTFTLNAAYCYGKDLKIKIMFSGTEPSDYSKYVCSPYLLYINNYIYDANNSSTSSITACPVIDSVWRDKTTRLALKVIANSSTRDTLDEINCNVYGKARIWSNNTWTTSKYPTRNPAAWILELMTTDIHEHSKYSDSEIDLEELGAMYEYCEDNDFYCDGIITSDTKKSDIISNILAENNTTMYLSNDGIWHFAIEQAQSTPVALLNENCIKNITVSKSFERKSVIIKTTYTDRDSWSVATIYQNSEGALSSADAYGEKKLITENASKYITTYEHAYKYSHRLLAKQTLQPREVTVQVGNEGDYYPLYSKILLQAQQLKIGYSSGIIKGVTTKAGLITAVTTSDFCDLTDTTKRYGLIVQAQNDNGKEHLYLEIVPNGLKTKELTLSSYASYSYLPEYGNVYSFGELNSDGTFTKITNEMMIYDSKANEDGWELTLKDYSESIFDWGTIPAYTPNLTIRQSKGTKLPTITYGDLQSAQLEAVASQKNVSSITMYWAVSTTSTSVPTEWSTTAPETDTNNRYLWGYTHYTYSDSSYFDTTPCVLGVHGATGASGSGFILDLSEETFALLDTVIETEGSTFSTTASLFHDSINYSKDEGVSYSATLNGIELASTYWTDNVITVPCSLLSTANDTNTMVITCTYDVTIEGVEFTGEIVAQATITKVYSGQSPTVYKMLVSDSQIAEDALGNVTPDSITIQKRKLNNIGESDTNTGYVTVEYDDSGTEEEIDGYKNQASESYDASATYYEVVEPFSLSLTEDVSNSCNVLGNGNDTNGTTVAGVFYD